MAIPCLLFAVRPHFDPFKSSPLMPPKRGTPASGIQTKRDGDRIIPASVRPDGSIRPERRVKAGYTPQEDVSVYKNERAEDFRRHQYGHKDYVPPGLAVGSKSRGKGEGVELGVGQEDPEKKARALQKKIKAARDLKARMERGDKLEDSQVAKIRMLETFEKELAAMNLEEPELMNVTIP
jgi:partner of Y14 and mago